MSGVINKKPKQPEVWFRKAKGSGLQSLVALTWKRRFFRFEANSVAWYDDESSSEALGEAYYQGIDEVILEKADGELVLKIVTSEKTILVTTEGGGTMKSNAVAGKLIAWGSLLQHWISYATKKEVEIPLCAMSTRESLCVLKHHPGSAKGWVQKARKAKGGWKKRYLRVGEKAIGWFENDGSAAIALGELPFSSINTVRIDAGVLVVRSMKKSFFFQEHPNGDPMSTWRIVFLRCLSYGRSAPLIGIYEDALPSAVKEKLRLYDSGNLAGDGGPARPPSRKSGRTSPRKSPRLSAVPASASPKTGRYGDLLEFHFEGNDKQQPSESESESSSEEEEYVDSPHQPRRGKLPDAPMISPRAGVAKSPRSPRTSKSPRSPRVSAAEMTEEEREARAQQRQQRREQRRIAQVEREQRREQRRSEQAEREQRREQRRSEQAEREKRREQRRSEQADRGSRRRAADTDSSSSSSSEDEY